MLKPRKFEIFGGLDRNEIELNQANEPSGFITTIKLNSLISSEWRPLRETKSCANARSKLQARFRTYI